MIQNIKEDFKMYAEWLFEPLNGTRGYFAGFFVVCLLIRDFLSFLFWVI